MKKFFVFLLITILIVMNITYLVSCDGKNPPPPSDDSKKEETNKPSGTIPEDDKHTHAYASSVTQPTCTEDGYTEYICDCGDSYIDSIIKANGHRYIAIGCKSCRAPLPEKSDGLEYTLSDDGNSYYITGLGSCKDSYIIISDSYNGLPVSAIGYKAFYKTDICGVVLSNSIINIERYAFAGCEKLTYIHLAGGVERIEDNAFSNCKSLEEISLPEFVTYLGSFAFENCVSLKSASLGNRIYAVPGYVFSGCTSLSQISLGKKVSSIQKGAFEDCLLLEEISLPPTLSSIDENAFANCEKLTELTLPDNVFEIKSAAFKNCIGLKHLSLGKNLSAIDSDAFLGCVNLERVDADSENSYFATLNGNLYTYDYSTILLYTSGNDNTFFEIPDTVNTIASYAFACSYNLLSVTLPRSLTSINANAFYECPRLVEVYNLSDIEISEGSSANGSVAFYAMDVYSSHAEISKIDITEDGFVFYEANGNQYLIAYFGDESDITLPDSIYGKTYEIGDGAFSYCTNIEKLSIPYSVTEIGSYAFYACSSLREIKLSSELTGIPAHAFERCCAIEEITIPDTVISIGYSAFNSCTSLSNISLPKKLTTIESYAFYNCRALESINIPSSLKSIGFEAFTDCKSLEYVSTSEINSFLQISFASYTSNPIYYSNVLYCDGNTVTEIVIPSNLKNIDKNVFRGWDTLEVINVEDGNEYYSSVDGNLYSYDGQTLIKYAPGKKADEFTIPPCVTNIESYAFAYCKNLESITIGESVLNIGQYAFYNCVNIEKIKFYASYMQELTSPLVNIFGNAGRYGNGITVYIGANVKTIPSYLFSSHELLSEEPKITKVIFEDESACESIGDCAFFGCRELKYINLPDSIVYLGDNAFYATGVDFS